MSTLSPRDSLTALRPWTARSAEHLAAAATLLLERLGLEPAPETTAAPRLTARTIRYYVAQGLLSPPEGQTRRAVYRYRHLLELLWIKAAQARGQALDDIRRELQGSEGAGAPDVDDLEVTLLRRLPARAPQPLPGSPAELDRAVSLRLSRRLPKKGWSLSGGPAPADALHSPVCLSADEANVDPVERMPVLFSRMPAPDHPGPVFLASEAGYPDPPASLQVQVDLGQGIRLLIPADHPLAEEILDRGLTAADLYRLLHGQDPPGRDGDG